MTVTLPMYLPAVGVVFGAIALLAVVMIIKYVLDILP